MKTQEHTAGAERAARCILTKFGTVHEHWVSDCADIIDRETKLPQLLKALEMLHRIAIQTPSLNNCDDRDVIDGAWAAICSAKGETP